MVDFFYDLMYNQLMLESLLDALKDTALMIPILYLVYLLVSFFSHNNNQKFSKFLHHTNKFGPLIGASVGIIPQCGFSSVMADLYSKRSISLGTLIAVFIATSDEAIPIMLSEPKFIVPLLILIALKFAFAVIFGFGIEFFTRVIQKKKYKPVEIGESSHHHECCHHDHDCCADNIFLDALKHTLNIVVFVFIATFFINIVIHYVGIEGMANLFGGNKYLEVLIAGVVGLIPNCAASVFLVELFMSGALGFGALFAGLSVGAGVGLLVLFNKNRKNIKENILITGLLYVFGLISGFIVAIFC